MTVRTGKRTMALLGSAAAASILLAACGSSSSSSTTAASPSAPAPSESASAAPSESASTPADPACADYAVYGDLTGKSVSISASIVAPESDKWLAAWAPFEKCTGVKINYNGANTFEDDLKTSVKGGNPPDIAFIPQPGLLQSLVKQDAVKEPPAAVVDNMKNWNDAWKQYGSVDGKFYAAPLGSNYKSLVWYSPKAFKDAGIEIPKTWDEVKAASDKIVAAGKAKPWCGGIESGGATGWAATDWLEQAVMRLSGPEVYDKWISHDIKFDSPEITKAMDFVAAWMKNDKWVNGGFGGVSSIATTKFQDAGLPILKGQCYMLQQASFYANQFPKGTKVAEDGDVYAFYLPGLTADAKPGVGGGEFVAAFADRPEVQAVQTLLSSTALINEKIKLGDWVTANKAADPSLFKNPIDKLSFELLTDPAATFRFDASDLMPAAVGAGEEWKQMTAWFASDKPTADVLKAIDAAWPN